MTPTPPLHSHRTFFGIWMAGVVILAGCDPQQTAQLPPAKSPTLAPPWQLAPPSDPGRHSEDLPPSAAPHQSPPQTPVSPESPVSPSHATTPADDDNPSESRTIRAKNPLIKGIGKLAESVPIDEENQSELLDSLEDADQILTDVKNENRRALQDLNRQVQLRSEGNPHIVLVVANQLPRQHFRSMTTAARRASEPGAGPAETLPHLNQIANQGAVFHHFYSGGVTSSESFWSILTGRDMSQRKGSDDLPSGMTLPEVLWKAGYQTAFVGHWPLKSSTSDRQRGFDEWFGAPSTEDPHFPQFILSSDTRVRVPQNANGVQAKFADDLYTDEAIAMLRRRDRRRPLFLIVSYTSPGAAEGLGVGDIAAELASKLDREIKRLDDELGQQRMLRSTAVVITSTTAPTSGQPEFRGNLGGLYEGGLRVPLVVRWPLRIQPQHVEEPFGHWDLLKTLGAMAKAIRIPRGSDSLSAVPYVVTSRFPKPAPKKRMLYWEHRRDAGVAQAIRMGDWKVVRPAGRTSRDDVELYNLHSDPSETRNVAESFPEIVNAFLRGGT